MAKRKYKKIIVSVKLIVIVMLFLGCSKNVVEEAEKTTEITLNKGAFVDESTDYKTFNLNSDNKYEQIDIGNEVINNFNIKSSKDNLGVDQATDPMRYTFTSSDVPKDKSPSI